MAEQPKPKKKHGCMFYGCITTVVLVMLLAGGAFALYQYGMKALVPACQPYLDAVKAGDFDAAYDVVGQAWRDEQSKDKFVAFHRKMAEQLGAAKSLSFAGVNVETQKGAARATLTFDAEFENTDAVTTITLGREDGKWKVIGIGHDIGAAMAPYADPYFDACERDDFNAAYDTIGKVWRNKQTREEFVEFHRNVRNALGKCKTRKVESTASTSAGEVRIVVVILDAQFEKAKATIRVNLMREDEKWVILGATYNSSALEGL